MNSSEIRAKFQDFFSARGHRRVASSSLVPQDDPTLLFTNAGMVQFKRLFTGEEKRDYQKAVTAQKCVRAGGKHNDLENVGYTARHHTFFEMLGNFSFGVYFKSQAIEMAWELLTKGFNLPADRLYATIYQNDDDAFTLWQKIAGLPESRIIRLGEKDNFWAMGDTGPCGPCSEILIDQGPELGCDRPDCAPGCDCDRYLEIWNLVFMQFERGSDNKLNPLPKPSIDTGMGLERLAAVTQGVSTNFETDLFIPLLERISQLSGQKYIYKTKLQPQDPSFQSNVSIRVIADHARSVTFLIADGVRPENLGRGYVLRRILRRAVRHGRKLGLTKPFLSEIIDTVITGLKDAYPELTESAAYIRNLVTAEEERFGETLGSGLSILSEAIDQIKRDKGKVIDGALTFKLYDTFGFPVDLVADVAREHNLTIDETGFDTAMAAQKAKGRAAWKAGDPTADETLTVVNKLTAEGFKNQFVGYDHLELSDITPTLIIQNGQAVTKAAIGDEVTLILPQTPFYATSGGQTGDRGTVIFPNGQIDIVDVSKAPGSGIFLHRGTVTSGQISPIPARLLVNQEIRKATANNHSATHLLHKALRSVLGDHVRQAGSMVSCDRLRFDFTHNAPISEEETDKIELLVNLDISSNYPVDTTLMSHDKAVRSGAMALFEERYGEEVRVVTMGNSRELCGGTHTNQTGNIGLFFIASESAVSAGIRRLECLTGKIALTEIQAQRSRIKELAGIFKSKPEELVDRIKKLGQKVKELEKTNQAQATTGLDPVKLLTQTKEKNGLKCLTYRAGIHDPKSLRELGDSLRERLGPSAVMALAAESQDGKALFLVTVSPEITNRFKAGQLVASMAEVVGGKGGGRPDLAQAGGPDISSIPKALALIEDLVLN